MARSAIKGLELNDGDADIRKSSSIMSRIYVEGYDTWLSGYDFVISIIEHFASCGEVIHVYIPGYRESSTRNLHRFALVYLRGEGAEEKALKLSGSDTGGHKLDVKPYPFNANHLDPELSPMRDADNLRQHMLCITGYDTSLPVDYVKSMLIQHFSKCGRVLRAVVSEEEESKDIAFVFFRGEDTVEKALQLCRCDVEGLKNIEVSSVAAPSSLSSASGCSMPSWMLEQARLHGEKKMTTDGVESSEKK